ncbi:MAG: hypothetical protein ACREUT_08405 [Steroidobacteraceae bacterium]
MSGRKSPEGRAVAAATAAIVLLCGSSSAALAATYFVPSIGATAAWTDNIDLTPPGQAEAGEFADLEPGFSLTHDSAREHANIDYTLHALFFSGGNHDFLHSGTLASITQVLPDWFEVDIAGQRQQGMASPTAPADLEYFFPVANVGNFTSGEIKPVLKHAFRSFRIDASYSRGISEDDLAGGPGTLEYRSNERAANFAVSSIDKNARLTWDGAYQREQDDYESPYTLDFLYEQVKADLGLLTVPGLRLLAQGGKESNPQNGIADGGLASPLYAAGFDWSSGPRDDLKLLVGHRYFGRSYEGHWRRETRMLKLQVDYTESPATLDEMLTQAPLAAAPVVQIPGSYGYTRLAPDVFLEKMLSGAATITGRLTEIGLSISSSEQTYYATATPSTVIVPRRRFAPEVHGAGSSSDTSYSNDRYQTAMLYVTRHLGPLTDVKLSATLGKYDYVTDEESKYTYQDYSIVLTRKVGRRSSVYVRGDRMRQYGQIAAFDADMVIVGVNMSFGNPPPISGGGGSVSHYEP